VYAGRPGVPWAEIAGPGILGRTAGVTAGTQEMTSMTVGRDLAGGMMLDSRMTIPVRPSGRWATMDAWALGVLILAGLNAGALGLFGAEILAMVFGPHSVLNRVGHLLFGAAAVYGVVRLGVRCWQCHRAT